MTRGLLRTGVSMVSASALACGGANPVPIPVDGQSPVGVGSTPDAGTPVAMSPLDGGSTVSGVVDGQARDAGAADADVYHDAAGAPGDGGDGGVDVLAGLRAITSRCSVASNGTYVTDRSRSAAIDICKLQGAFFWTADMAIDCDGQPTARCNKTTDPSFGAQTSIAQSNGQPLVASQLPYAVIPLPSSRFDYTKEGIALGALVVVLYGDQIEYGVLGDEGPTNVVGEASYAMAASFGLDPDPKTGGTPGAVTYVVLTGTSAVVAPVESHAAAVSLAASLVPALIAGN